MPVTSDHGDDPAPVRQSILRRGLPMGGVAALNTAAVIVAAVYLARALLVPLVLAALLAFVLTPMVGLLRRARLGPVRLGQAPAVVLTVLLAFAVISGIGLVVGQQVGLLAHSLPSYKPVIQEKAQSLRMGGEVIVRLNDALQNLVGEVSAPHTTEALVTVQGAPGTAAAPAASLAPAAGAGPVAGAAPVPGVAPAVGPALRTALDGASALVVVRGIVPLVLPPLATAGIVMVFVLFVLLYRGDLRDRMIRLVGRHDLHRTILAMNDATHRLQRYFITQLALNTGFGTFIAVGLWAVGLPNPLLWGILAGLMRFVPFIGTPVSVLPPVLLALAVAPGWSMALWVLGLFVLSVLIEGQVVEPLMYGHSTGLSPIAIVLSAGFWTFLWGPIGLLLATPLTVCLVVLGRHIERLRFLEVMLGDRPPLDPEETFYQRALEGDPSALLAQAAEVLRERTLADYYDAVALRGLALAQADLSRDQLGFERLDAIHSRIGLVLDGLAACGPRAATDAAVPRPDAWREDGSVVCIPGRGQLDDLAATMAVQVLCRQGYGARVEANAVLGAGARQDFSQVRLCCLSVLEDGSSVSSVRYFLRRIRRRLPNATVVVGLWHAQGSSAMLDALRAEGPGETIITSLQELVTLCHAVSAPQLRVAELDVAELA